MSWCCTCGSTDNSFHYCEECLEYVCDKCNVSGKIWDKDSSEVTTSFWSIHYTEPLRVRNTWWCKECSQLYHRCHRCICMVAKTESFYCVPCNIFTDEKYPICIGCHKHPRCFHCEEDVKLANELTESQIKIVSIGEYRCCVSSTKCLTVEVNKLKQRIKELEAKL